MRRLSAVFLITAGLFILPWGAGHAQEEVDIDAMIQQLEGVPGAEAAIEELKRKRSEIEAAQKKARERQDAVRAQSGAPAGQGRPSASGRRSAPKTASAVDAAAILKMIPAPPKTVKLAKQRLTKLELESSESEGDRDTVKASKELERWGHSMRDAQMRLVNPPNPTSVEEMQAIQVISTELSRLNTTAMDIARLQEAFEAKEEAEYHAGAGEIESACHEQLRHCDNPDADLKKCEKKERDCSLKLMRHADRQLERIGKLHAQIRSKAFGAAESALSATAGLRKRFKGKLPPSVEAYEIGLHDLVLKTLAGVARQNHDVTREFATRLYYGHAPE